MDLKASVFLSQGHRQYGSFEIVQTLQVKSTAGRSC